MYTEHKHMYIHDNHKGTGSFPNNAMLGMSWERSVRARVQDLLRVPAYNLSKEYSVMAVPRRASQFPVDGQEVPVQDGVRQET